MDWGWPAQLTLNVLPIDLENLISSTLVHPPGTLFFLLSWHYWFQFIQKTIQKWMFWLCLPLTTACWRSWTCRIAAPYKFRVDWLIDWLISLLYVSSEFIIYLSTCIYLSIYLSVYVLPICSVSWDAWCLVVYRRSRCRWIGLSVPSGYWWSTRRARWQHASSLCGPSSSYCCPLLSSASRRSRESANSDDIRYVACCVHW